MLNRYTEDPTLSERSRHEYLGGILSLLDSGFSNLPYKKNVSPLEDALGAPLNRDVSSPCTMSQEYVGHDDLCEIYRLRFCPLPNVPFFCLLFVPHKLKENPSPLVIAAHGLLGTPELMYGMHGKNGYSDLIGRLLKKNVCVLAPSFLLWNCDDKLQKPCYETKFKRVEIDRSLKKLGGSMTALEIFFLLRALDAMSNLRFIDTAKIAACGMSYGAFLTLRTMAVSEKIRAGYFMSCANGSIDNRWPEWSFREPFVTLRDGELLALCAPRPVYVEVGKFDDIFPVEGATRESETARLAYEAKGCSESFNFSVWNGGHIVNPESFGVDFLISRVIT